MGLTPVGVELVVEGLSAFVSDMDKGKESILNMIAPPSLLQDAFGALGGALGNFASWVGDVLTFTIGGLLKDAIEGVISVIGEMVDKTIEAGKEFQTLSLRLDGMNFQALIDSGVEYNTALKQSTDLTQQQLQWLQKLAAATPFDNKDISNIYTLARSYGFADGEARTLVNTIANFTASMGLSDVEMKRIVVNLGQMQAAGKITGRELTDMARGAFVPVNAIMDRVAASMGKTTDEVNKMRAAGEKIPPELFIEAFNNMVAEEPRFIGAASRMARTFGAATDNVMDLASSFGGLNIVTPILDVIGGKIADFMDQFIKSDEAGQSFTDLGQRFLDASVSIGDSLTYILEFILAILLPSAKEAGEGLVGAIEGFAQWLDANKGKIVLAIMDIHTWFMSLGQTDFFKEGGIIDKLKELWDQLFLVNDETGKNGFQALAEAIGKVAISIGKMLEPFLKPLGVELGKTTTPSVQGLVDTLINLSKWIDENAELLRFLLGMFIAFQIIQTLTNLVFGFILGLISLIVTIALVAAGFVGLVSWIVILTTSFIAWAGIIQLVTGTLFILQVAFTSLEVVAKFAIDLIIGHFTNMVSKAAQAIAEVKRAIETGDWAGAIRNIINLMAQYWRDGFSNVVNAVYAAGQRAVDGFSSGFFSKWTELLNNIGNAFAEMVAFIKYLLGIASPSTVFADVGTNMILGLAQGITSATGQAVSAMESVVSAVSIPAMTLSPNVMQMAPATISTSYNNTNNLNLSIHSNARSEDVAADFSMMAALAGV